MASESNIFFLKIGIRSLLRKFYYMINIFSMKNKVCMCNISTEQKMCCLQIGIENDKIT